MALHSSESTKDLWESGTESVKGSVIPACTEFKLFFFKISFYLF